ncbi:MAG: FG-GAP-like repeat-containing protein [candidate division WOR-3 bacterium]
MYENKRHKKEESKDIEDIEIDDETEILDDETELISSTSALEETTILPLKNVCFIGIHGPLLGKKYPIRPGITKIGRSEDFNDIVLKDDKKASKRHATIISTSGKYLIFDKRSRNRTYVNRKKIKEDEKIILNIGDEIEIGSSIFRFCEEGKEDFSPPHRAGSFIIRNKYSILRIISFIILLVLVYFSYKSYVLISTIKQKPNPLQIREIERKIIDFNINQHNFADYRSSIAIVGCANKNFNNIAFCNNNKEIEILMGRGLQKFLPRIKGEQFDVSNGVTIVDIDNNGIDDIVVLNLHSQVEIFDGQHGVLIEKSDFLGAGLLPPSLGDLDGDLYPDLIVPSKIGNIYFGLLQKREFSSYNINDELASSAVIGDINSDDDNEVLCISKKGIVYILDGKTRQLKESGIDLSKKLFDFLKRKPDIIEVLTDPAIGNINNTPENEIVISCRHGYIIVLNGKSKEIIWCKDLFRELEKFPVQFPLKYASPILADFNTDGLLDIFVASLNGSMMVLRGYDGRILWLDSLDSKELVVATPALADLNKDGTPDVICVTEPSGIVYVLNGKDGKVLTKVFTGHPITTSPVVCDIDGDGFLDIIVLNNVGEIIILSSNTRIKKNTIVWGMEKLNSSRTGSFLIAQTNLRPSYVVLFLTGFVVILLLIQNFVVEVRKRKQSKLV